MNASQQIIEALAMNEPPALVQSFAQKSGKPVAEIEALWDKLKAQAKKKGLTGDRVFEFVVGTMKKILKVS